MNGISKKTFMEAKTINKKISLENQNGTIFQKT
jgi:hypothetical protein